MFRICRAAHVALDGEGARLYGGRWNSPGRPVVYASTSRTLAALEYLVHIGPLLAPTDLVLLTIELPDEAIIERVRADELARGWEREVESASCVARGDGWLKAARAPALRVPSAVMPEEENVLLNPRCPGAELVRMVDSRGFGFDARLL